jgi:hypothetical protein
MFETEDNIGGIQFVSGSTVGSAYDQNDGNNAVYTSKSLHNDDKYDGFSFFLRILITTTFSAFLTTVIADAISSYHPYFSLILHCSASVGL